MIRRVLFLYLFLTTQQGVFFKNTNKNVLFRSGERKLWRVGEHLSITKLILLYIFTIGIIFMLSDL